MHVLVRVVPDLPQQPAERVLHRAGHHRVTVCLHGRQVQDLRPGIHRRNLDAVGKDVVQLEQRALEAIDPPLDVRQRRERDAVAGSTGSQRLFRQPSRGSVTTVLFSIGIRRCAEAVREHLREHAVDLPRLRRARREVLRPGQVELDERVAVARERVDGSRPAP